MDDIAITGEGTAAEEHDDYYELWGNPGLWSIRGSRGQAWRVRGL